MESLYWTFEYGSVLSGYLFLMFLWPTVVFNKHLKGKSFTYRFGFCVTVQPVIVSTVVLGLGLFHILNRQLVAGLFYSVFLIIFLYKAVQYGIEVIRDALKEQKDIIHFARSVKRELKGSVWDLSIWMRPRFIEHAILILVLFFGVIYFSYGSSQLHGYGCGDLSVHHSWIYGLMEGKIFFDGVYPEAMHCFVYCLNALFGIQIYSILLYLQCAHVVVFLLSAYCLLKEVFRWKYTPILVLALYVILDVVGADMIYSMSRLQWTLPLEFGLHTQFLCALFLVRYLKNSLSTVWKGKTLKYCWDSNLFLFMASLAASISIHYYTTIMAFLVCVSFAVFAWRKIFCRRHFIPLCCAVLCGCLIAIFPMAGALASGIPFNYSIRWALNSMDGESTRDLQKEREEEQKEEQKSSVSAEADSAVKDVSTQNSFRLFWERLSGIWYYGYVRLYGKRRAACILILTVISIILEVVGLLRRCRFSEKTGTGYAPVIMISILFILTYAMPYVGFPELISDSRFCSSGHMMVLAVLWMPFDAILSRTIGIYGNIVQQGMILFSVLGIYITALLTGSYRGFLFYAFTRYDSAVMVTNSIIEAFPKYGFVIISPTDELYPIIQYGWHQELATFLKNCENADYTVSSEYVFIYVEKKPFLYAQSHFFEGPFWLGQEKYMETYWEEYSKKYPDSGSSQSPEIITSDVSTAEAQKDIANMANEWNLYIHLESRTILESRAYEWCQRFTQLYPHKMKVYYEDESFVCYYFMQDVDAPYKLGVR